MDNNAIYLIQYFGDLERDRGPCMKTFSSLLDALSWLHHNEGWGKYIKNADYEEWYETPDPEDDRILIWELAPEKIGKVVWHFSGWHWSSDANEFVGGPLPQGKLPGFDKTLYELAMDDM